MSSPGLGEHMSPRELIEALANYPRLRAADLVHAWAYADAHQVEIDKAIAENEAA